MQKNTTQRGYNLIELMVIVAILSILLAVAVPSYVSITRSIKLNSVSSAVAASLQQAKSEAIKLNRRVMTCASNAAGTDCQNTTDWGLRGWLVCYDANADGACDAATATLPNPIRVENKVDAAVITVTGPAAPIRFNTNGSQGGVGAAAVSIAVTGTWQSAPTKSTAVAATGNIKTTKF